MMRDHERAPDDGAGADEFDLADFAAYWPDMDGIPDGDDMFAQYPIAGQPTGEDADDGREQQNRMV